MNRLIFTETNGRIIFIYPEAGKIYRVDKNSKEYEVGCIADNGYLKLVINGGKKVVSCHRFIFEAHHDIKLTPKQFICHKNGIRTDNRISNLEIGDSKTNTQQRGKNKNNSSGYKNIYWDTESGKWKVAIAKKSYGRFIDIKDAILKRDEIIKELNKDGNNFITEYPDSNAFQAHTYETRLSKMETIVLEICGQKITITGRDLHVNTTTHI